MAIWATFFQISEQKFAQTEMVGGFDTCESFKNDSVIDVKYI